MKNNKVLTISNKIADDKEFLKIKNEVKLRDTKKNSADIARLVTNTLKS